MFPGADQLTKGNVSEGVWLLTGPPTSGKTSYVVQFLYEHLQAQKACVLTIFLAIGQNHKPVKT
jgi:KaiC/GvpD/RAD55 family RecA-like ATPase